MTKDGINRDEYCSMASSSSSSSSCDSLITQKKAERAFLYSGVSDDEDVVDDDEEYPPMLFDEPIIQQETYVEIIIKDMKRNYYFTLDWTPRFYVSLTYHGFIPVAWNQYLVPEIQKSYAILDFKDLHIPKKIRKLLISDKFVVKTDNDFTLMLRKLTEVWDGNSWLIEKYQNLAKLLHLQGPIDIDPLAMPSHVADKKSCGKGKFRFHSFELWLEFSDDDGDDADGGQNEKKKEKLVAADVGYTIGRTYTSLTGFLDAEEKKRNKGCGIGILQLCCLGVMLNKLGYAFWNLGHPPIQAKDGEPAMMQYKADLGCHIVSRKKFKHRWDIARHEDPVFVSKTSTALEFQNKFKQNNQESFSSRALSSSRPSSLSSSPSSCPIFCDCEAKWRNIESGTLANQIVRVKDLFIHNNIGKDSTKVDKHDLKKREFDIKNEKKEKV